MNDKFLLSRSYWLILWETHGTKVTKSVELMPAIPLTLRLCVPGSRLSADETTASTVVYEVHADLALSASEFEIAFGNEGIIEKFQGKETFAWLALLEEVTTDSRAMTDEERRAVDDFFLSRLDVVD